MLSVVHRAITQWEIDTYLIYKDIADIAEVITSVQWEMFLV